MKTLVLIGNQVGTVSNIGRVARKGNRLSFRYFGGTHPGLRRYVSVEGISNNGNLLAKDCRVQWEHPHNTNIHGNNFRQFKPEKMAEIRLIRGKLQ